MSESWQAVLLAILQGLTEFLPISSSAHLILPSQVLGWADQGLAFDIAVHVGSLLAVVIYFRRELWSLAVGGLQTLRGGGRNAQSDMILWLFLHRFLRVSSLALRKAGIASVASTPMIATTIINSIRVNAFLMIRSFRSAALALSFELLCSPRRTIEPPKHSSFHQGPNIFSIRLEQCPCHRIFPPAAVR